MLGTIIGVEEEEELDEEDENTFSTSVRGHLIGYGASQFPNIYNKGYLQQFYVAYLLPMDILSVGFRYNYDLFRTPEKYGKT